MGGASQWTEILVEELRQAWAAGLSATVIAKQLGNGISRSAVIGKAHRLDLPPHKHAPSASGPTRLRRTYKQRTVRVLITRQLPPEPEVPRPPRMRRLPLLELEEGQCKWPVGSPRDKNFFFCAADAVEGRPYCGWHLDMAFVKRKGA